MHGDVEVARPYMLPGPVEAFALGLCDVAVWYDSLIDNGSGGCIHLLPGTRTALLGWGLALEALWCHRLCLSGSLHLFL